MKKMALFIAFSILKKKKSMRGKKPLSHQEGVMSHKYRFSLHSVTSLGCRVIQYLHARRS